MGRRTGVYKITNLVDGKVYVGSSSTDLTDRITTHKRELNKKEHANRYLQRAWDKYGEQSFSFEVVLLCKPEICLKEEQKYMDLYRSYDYNFGYNLCPTAGSSKGVKLSEETCKKISESKKGVFVGRKVSEETRKKMSEAMKGNKNGLGHRFSRTPESKMKLVKDITGLKVGRLTAIRYVRSAPHAIWLCRCDCGVEKEIYGNALKRGKTRSCGCLLTDMLIDRNKKNSGRKHSEEHRQAIRIALMGNKNARRKEPDAS